MMNNSNLAYELEPREELIGGKIVAMSPRPAFNHNRVAFRIACLFETYLKGKRCTVLPDGTDLYLTEEDRFVPDMMVVCDRDKIKADGVHGAPDLVVEVLSPSTAQNDRHRKQKVYESCGVREYWIADAANRTIEQYFLQDGTFQLNAVYPAYREWELRRMTEEERAAVVTCFKCSLFDDFEIALADIFTGLLPDTE